MTGTATGPQHEALVYRTDEEYVAGIGGFVEHSVRSGRRVVLALPRGRAELLDEPLRAANGSVTLVDIEEVGRNPGRIIPAVQSFLDDAGEGGLDVVGEPIWSGRSTAEIVEATRHEALVNTSFPGVATRFLCPYDASSLDRGVVADAARTHPVVTESGTRRRSRAYVDPAAVLDRLADLPPPPPDAQAITFDHDSLRGLREAVRHHAGGVGLAADRVEELVLAVCEIATNSIEHASGAGVLALWTEPGSVVCEVRDDGDLRADLLVGRRVPDVDGDTGRGVWLAHQLCDLVQARATAEGTVTRMSVDLV